jgi:16S rRNA (cytosine967-C5)-methyltransferase
MSDPRKLALEALKEVWARGGKPKGTMEALSGGLDNRDRAFLMELFYGVLRYRDTLDWMLGHYMQKPRRLPFETTNNLRLGLYQIFYMRVPEWAAVNEAVGIERAQPGLVNAVLRNAIRGRERLKEEMRLMEEAVSEPSTGESERVRNICTLTSHPQWLVRRWSKRLGWKEAFDLARANNTVPPLTLRVNTLRATRDEMLGRLLERGVESEPTPYSPDGIRLKGSQTFRELGWLGGDALVQDEAAQLVTLLLGPRPGERVLDACAAPGGKTTHIAQLMGDSGEVVAVDVDEKRIANLRENISSLGIKSVKIIKGDVTELKNPGSFHRVLLDAPCSSTGVIRRNPDVKYRHRPGDLLRFKAGQLALVRSVSSLLKPGGVLVYATCSTEPDEGEEVIKEFLKTSGDFLIIKDVPLEGPFYKDGLMRTYPHRDAMDGFFGIRIGKRP